MGDLQRLIGDQARADAAERELDESRRETAEARARADELEGLLREAVAENDYIVLNERHTDHPLWRARVALGLDGRTGHRDIHAEASHG